MMAGPLSSAGLTKVPRRDSRKEIADAQREIRSALVGGFAGQLVSGMRLFIALCGILVGAGMVLGLYWPQSFSAGGWITGAVLLCFAVAGGMRARAEGAANSVRP